MRKKRIIFISIGFSILITTNIILGIQFARVYRKYLIQRNFLVNPDFGVQNYNLNPSTKKILLFGDSRIYQWSDLPEIEKVEFIKYGFPGETSSQLLYRLNSLYIPDNTILAILQLGVNDIVTAGVARKKTEEIKINLINNLSEIIGRLSNQNIKVMVIPIFPLGRIPFPRNLLLKNDLQKIIDEINSQLTSIADDNQVLNLFDINGFDERPLKTFSLDTLHLNNEGYKVLNNVISNDIKKMLEK